MKRSQCSSEFITTLITLLGTLLLLSIAFILPFTLIPSTQAANATMVYISGSGTCGGTTNYYNCPKIRSWNSTGLGQWSNETELPTAGSPIIGAIIRYSNISAKRIIITSSRDNNLDAYVSYNNTDWIVTNNFANVSQTYGSRAYDFVFETSTGNAVLVYSPVDYSDGCDLAYRVLLNNETNWFNTLTNGCINDTTHDNAVRMDLNFTWVHMNPKPSDTSQEIAMAGFDRNNSDVTAWIWSGTSWGNIREITAVTSTTTGQGFDVQYSADGSKAMVAAGQGTTGQYNSSYWNGASWTYNPLVDIVAGTDDIAYMNLRADPLTDDLQMVTNSNANEISTNYWNGANWATPRAPDTAMDTTTTRGGDFAWNGTSSTGTVVLGTDTTGDKLQNASCTPECKTNTTSTIATISAPGTDAWISLYTVPPDSLNNATIIGIRANASTTGPSNSSIIAFALYTNGSFAPYNDTNLPRPGYISINATVIASGVEPYFLAFQKSPENLSVTPFVRVVQALPKSVLNQSIFNVTANVSSSDGHSIDTVRAFVYNPDGSWFATLPLQQVGTSGTYQNATEIMNASQFGSYQVSIYANNTRASLNYTENTSIAPFFNMSSNTTLTIDGTFSDWNTSTNLSDSQNDLTLAGPGFNITAFSIANNNTHLFVYMQLADGVNFSNGQYYRIFLTNGSLDGALPSGYPSENGTNTLLPFNYTRVIQLNNSECKIYNTTNGINGANNAPGIANGCYFSNNSNEIEIAAPLDKLGVSMERSINLTLKTANNTHTYDFVPNNQSFIQYFINRYNPPTTPPRVRQVQALPPKLLNFSAINVTANATCFSCTIQTVLGRIYYPNGTLFLNLNMTNGSDTIFQNSTEKPTAPFFGNFLVNFFANSTTGEENATENTTFAVFRALNQSRAIVIDGNFGDWDPVDNTSDPLTDNTGPLATELGIHRPYNGSTSGLQTNANETFDLKLNDQSTFFNLLTRDIYNITYQLPTRATQGTLYATGSLIAAVAGTLILQVYNWSSNAYQSFTMCSSSCAINTFSTAISQGNGLINSTENTLIKFSYTGGPSVANIYDTYISVPGGFYDYQGISSPSQPMNASNGTVAIASACSISSDPYCNSRLKEFATREYHAVALENGTTMTEAGLLSTVTTEIFHFNISEKRDDVQELLFRFTGNYEGDMAISFYNYDTSAWDPSFILSTDTSTKPHILSLNTRLARYINDNQFVHVLLEVSAKDLVTDYVSLSTLAKPSRDFDLNQVKLANNNTHLFTYMKLNGSVNFANPNQYYRLYLSTVESGPNSTTPDTFRLLPFNYSYRIQINNSVCTIFNSSNVTLGGCTFANDSDEIELQAPLSSLDLTTDQNINATFETSSDTEQYDTAPDYASFLNLYLNQTVEVAATCNRPLTGNWIVTGIEVCTNQLINLTGNLTVTNLGNLTFHNITLLVNTTYNGSHMINVSGMFFVNQSNLTSINASNTNYLSWQYAFRVFNPTGPFIDGGIHASAFINSYVSRAGWSDTEGQRGLEINGSLLNFINNTFTNNFIGLTLYNASIVRDFKSDAQLYGVYVLGNQSTFTHVVSNSSEAAASGAGIRVEGSNNSFNNATGLGRSQNAVGIDIIAVGGEPATNNSFINSLGDSNNSNGISIESGGNWFNSTRGKSLTQIGIMIFSNHNRLNNVTGESNGSQGIRLRSGATNNTITNSFAHSNTDIGLYLSDGNSNNITHTYANSTTRPGIEIDTDNNQFYNVTGNSNNSNGVLITSTATGNQINYSFANSVTQTAFYLTSTASGNLFINLTANSTRGPGLGIETNHSVFINVTAMSNTSTGILLNNSAFNNTLTNSYANSLTGQGIYLAIPLYRNNLTHTTGNSTTGPGIQVETNHSQFYNITGTSNNSQGITFTGAAATNNTLMYSTGISITGIGLWLTGSANGNNLTNVTGNSSTGVGIEIETNHSLFTNITALSNTSTGLLLNASAYNNSLLQTNGHSETGTGIYLNGDSRNNNLTNAKGNSTRGAGIRSSSQNNTFLNATALTQWGQALYFGFSNFTTVINLTIRAPAGTGVFLGYSNNITILGGTINASNGFNFTDTSNDNRFTDINLTNSSALLDVFAKSTGAGLNVNTTFLNVTFRTRNVTYSCTGTCTLNVNWWLNIQANTTKQSAVSGANITIKDVNLAQQFTELTDSNGMIPVKNLTEYVQTASATTVLTNYTANSTYANVLPVNQLFNLTQSTYLFLTFLDNCNKPATGDWNVNDTQICMHQIINLTGNITINATGNLTFHNVTLIINLTYNGTYGINNTGNLYINQSNITDSNNSQGYLSWQYPFRTFWNSNLTVMNSYISRAGWSDTYGMRGLEVNGTLQNFSGNTLSDSFIGITIYSQNNNLTNNTINTLIRNAMLYGIYILGVSGYAPTGNSILTNTIEINGSATSNGVRLDTNTNQTNITSNTITLNGTSTGNYGVYLLNTGSNNLTNNTINIRGTTSNYGVYLQNNIQNNIIQNNVINMQGSNTNYGIHLQGSSTTINNANTLQNNNIYTNGTGGGSSFGIYFNTNINNSLIQNNVISTNGPTGGGNSQNFGIYLLTSGNNTLSSNNVNTTGRDSNFGIYLFTNSNNNTLTGNNIISQLNQGNNNDAIRVATSSIGNVIKHNTAQTTGLQFNMGIRLITNVNQTTVYNNTFNANGTASTNSISIYLTDNAGNNNITGNTVTSQGTSFNVGIKLDTNALNNTLQGNNITTRDGTNNYGILLSGTNTGLLQGNLIQHNNIKTNGIQFEPGIYLQTNVNQTIIYNNTIQTQGTAGTQQNYGIWLDTYVGNNTIISNTIRTNGGGNGDSNYGIYVLASSNNNNLTGNTIWTDGDGPGNYGIYLLGSTSPVIGNLIQHNTIHTNGTTNNYGIYLITNVNQTTIQNNTITTYGRTGANNHGTYLKTQTGLNTITGNMIQAYSGSSGPNYGVVLEDFSNNNTLANNNITTNGTLSYAINTTTSNYTTFNHTLLSNPTQWIITDSMSVTNFTNTTFDAINGSINIYGHFGINITPKTINTSNVNITYNRTFVNSTYLPFLNTSAQILMRNISRKGPLTNPAAIVSFNDTNVYQTCTTAQCQNVSYTSGNGFFIFNVSSFTTYAVIDGNTNQKPNNASPNFPSPGDQVFTNRTPYFNWTNNTNPIDPDGNAVTFHLQIALDNAFSTIIYDNNSILNSYFAYPQELDFTTYFWRVRANDSFGLEGDFNSSNFTLVKTVDINLTTNQTTFGFLNLSGNNDTSDNDPPPFTIQNIGNYEVNLSINSTPLWHSVGMNTSQYMFKSNDTIGCTNCYDRANSITNYVVMSSADSIMFLNTLNHTTDKNKASADINITVPANEPPGATGAVIQFVARNS